MGWRIEKFVLRSGTCPFDEWFSGLDSSIKARVDTRMDRVSLGNFGDTKSLAHGVHELRLHVGPGYRIYYGLDSNKVVLLLTGGDKRSQKRDIKKAKQYWAEYCNEH